MIPLKLNGSAMPNVYESHKCLLDLRDSKISAANLAAPMFRAGALYAEAGGLTYVEVFVRVPRPRVAPYSKRRVTI